MVEKDGSFDGVVYLNNAGQAPLCEDSKKAGIEAVQSSPWEQASTGEHQAAVRTMYASLIDADADDIAIMPSTAFAITLAAVDIQRTLIAGGKRGKILLLEDQMNSAVYAWQQVCADCEDIHLDIVPYPTCSGWTEAVLDHISDDTIVACLPPLHWSDGSLLDLKIIGEKCRKHNVMLIVDATQAVGIMPFSAKEIQPAMVACSVHKWLRGPSGMSLVYIAKDVQPLWMPLDQHGRSRQVETDSSWDAAKDSMGPNGYPEKFVTNARKFDAGGKPNPILLPMLRVSMEKVVQLDLQQVQKDLQELTRPIVDWAAKNNFELSPGPQAWHLIGIRPSASKNMTPDQMIQVVSSLQREGILIAVRCGAFRISPYVDTQPEDIQFLLDGLSKYCIES